MFKATRKGNQKPKINDQIKKDEHTNIALQNTIQNIQND